jgi:hypothetical protein
MELNIYLFTCLFNDISNLDSTVSNVGMVVNNEFGKGMDESSRGLI